MKKTENCLHCDKEYTPTRKGVQTFCSNSCRSRYWYLKNSLSSNKTSTNETKDETDVEEKEKINEKKMSWSGVGDATIGNLAANTVTAIAKELFVPDHKKPSTKEDIKELKNLINTRYFLAHNVKPDVWGRKPYFDIGTGKILYFDEKANAYHLPQFDLG